MARSTYKMIPLAYMEEGQKRRDAGEFVKPTDAEELYFAFVEYCKFMQDNYFSQAHKNKNGEDCSVYISRPMTIGSIEARQAAIITVFPMKVVTSPLFL